MLPRASKLTAHQVKDEPSSNKAKVCLGYTPIAVHWPINFLLFLTAIAYFEMGRENTGCLASWPHLVWKNELKDAIRENFAQRWEKERQKEGTMHRHGIIDEVQGHGNDCNVSSVT